MNALYQTVKPANEPVLSYAPGSPERRELREALCAAKAEVLEIPLLIGGREVRTGKTRDCIVPHEHGRVLARFHQAGREEARAAVEACREAWAAWSNTDWQERVAISLKAAELLAGRWRARINAAAMLNLSKTVHQAEIDAACELTDLLRFNTWFMQCIYNIQPESVPTAWNRLEYRPLEGFITAIAPFNFVSISGNLPMSPAVMGNVVIWKPASTAVLPSYVFMQVLREAGLPDGVVNFLPGESGAYTDVLLGHPEFAGLHFTGSNRTFNMLWKAIGSNVGGYRSYPRVVGETGGKNFAVVHASAEVCGTAACLVRGAFEYQGQKCSATSRAYVARGIWPALRRELDAQLDRVRVGPTEDFENFMGAVIDRGAFDKIISYVELARKNNRHRILRGGTGNAATGYYIEPTIVLAEDPGSPLMTEEIFGPVLTIYLYEDAAYPEVLDLCDRTSPFGLTGAVFAQDRRAIHLAEERLRFAAGNFYINDKTTGAVVGHQPFGGARASGTNDKAGSVYNLQRWISVRTIKESFALPEDFAYSFMAPD